jgi:hypothetical protein
MTGVQRLKGPSLLKQDKEGSSFARIRALIPLVNHDSHLDDLGFFLDLISPFNPYSN